ncbi:hypothetical protein [Amycolatopsis anabasis]|uniref:hypothetical protein n=1 Tax=Amycolatopsis anabasis TaxID=1840409 RepID=UPI00131B65A4|nr:hypothetical protein [Amycolatopsis anabasis]
MDGTPRQGFHVEEGAYGSYARQIDPLGDEVRGAVDKHLAPHADVDGDGFGELGHETGLADAYRGRMQGLQDDIRKLGGNWRDMADASRRTQGNYDVLEGDHQQVMRDLGKDLA